MNTMTPKKVLVCSQLMPEFDRESGSRRIYDLIELLHESGWAVTFVAQYAPNGERYVRLLQQRGIAVHVGFDARFDRMLASGEFHLALIAFWHIAEQHLPVLRQLSPDTRVLIDSIDLHFMRNARGIFKLGSASGGRLLDQGFAAEMVREVNTYASADGVLTVSPKEAELINDLTADPGLAHSVPDCEVLDPSPLPFADRKGVLFLGNFRHAPNVSAAEFLCRQVLPHVDPKLLAEHPVSIVGNEPNGAVREAVQGVAGVQLVGWVPSVLPYLNQSRLTVVPLLYGAGTKRKLLQSLMVGTPAVSTTVGIEGLNIQHEHQVLVADDPRAFAKGIERLLQDQALWQRLSLAGRKQVLMTHGREKTKNLLTHAIDAVMAKPPKTKEFARPTHDHHIARVRSQYQALIPRVHAVIRQTLPVGSRVLMVSKGDEELVRLEGYQTGHFPQTPAGVYAGHHPVDSAAAIVHLEALVAKGAEYLLFPHTAAWWLKHYVELERHLGEKYTVIAREAESCVIYSLAARQKLPAAAASKSSTHGAIHPDDAAVMKISSNKASINGTTTNGTYTNGAPTVGTHAQPAHSPAEPTVKPSSQEGPALRELIIGAGRRKRVLVIGVYLANQTNTADEVVANLAGSRRYDVVQRWIGLWGTPPTERVAAVTARIVRDRVPKYQLLNELLQQEDLSRYEYVVSVDDDIVLQPNFLDQYLPLQSDLDFVIAQPARTSNSYTDHPIVEQQRGVLARQTLFVEIGPVISFHRSVFPIVFPFDLTSPMGWGYENVWSHQLSERGLKMGIIDALPVDHSLRKPVANYNWDAADLARSAYLTRHPHRSIEECFRVVDVINVEEAIRE